MEGEYTDVTPESSPGTTDTGSATGPAPSTQVGGDPSQSQYVPYGRFAEINRAYRDSVAQSAVYQDRASRAEQQLEQYFREAQLRQAQAQQPPDRLPDGWDQAGNELYNLVSRHPKFAQWMQLMQAAPALAMGYQNAQQIAASVQEQQAQRYIADEHVRLGYMARQSGLPSTEQDVLQLSYQVAGLINGNQRAKDAYLAGDRSILDRAFNVIRQSYDNHRRSATAALANNKNALSRLPPRPAGGPPGHPSQLPKLDVDNPRPYESAMHRLAERMMSE